VIEAVPRRSAGQLLPLNNFEDERINTRSPERSGSQPAPPGHVTLGDAGQAGEGRTRGIAKIGPVVPDRLHDFFTRGDGVAGALIGCCSWPLGRGPERLAHGGGGA